MGQADHRSKLKTEPGESNQALQPIGLVLRCKDPSSCEAREER